MEFLSGVAEIVKHHHESFDGRGYPDGLRGEDIPLGARVVVCGTMGMGNSPEGPRYNRHILVKRAMMQGFLVFDHWDRRAEAQRQLEAWLAEGRIAYLEDVTDGLNKAPETLCRMLAGDNLGKTLIRVGPEPGENA